MKYRNRIYIILLFLSMANLILDAQGLTQKGLTPEVGKSYSAFVLTGIENYSKKEINVSDFKGKWLILDFWSIGCTSCLKSFPHVNAIQQELKDKIQIMLVGIYYPNNKYWNIEVTKSTYHRLYSKLKLELATGYLNYDQVKQFVSAFPFVVVIDPTGVVRGITNSVNKEELVSFLSGNQPSLTTYFTKDSNPSSRYDFTKALDGQSTSFCDTCLLYKSILRKWDVSIPQRFPEKVGLNEFGRFDILKAELNFLYMYAFFGTPKIFFNGTLYGKVWGKPILEIKDSSKFAADWVKGKNLYSYSFSSSDKNISDSALMKILRRELENYFGYSVSIENRKMPYWRLVATPAARKNLKTRGYAAIAAVYPYSNPTFINEPVSKLLAYIQYDHSDDLFIDETGITGNIDITLDCVMQDFDGVVKALRTNGLDLVKGEREMKVLIIRDK